MARYGAKAQQKVERAMHERKEGTLRSGRSGKKVTSRKQAIGMHRRPAPPGAPASNSKEVFPWLAPSRSAAL